MDLIADSLLIGGAIAAAFYCWVLSVRVRSLKDLDKGLGGAIAQSGGLISCLSIAGFAWLTKISLDLVIQLSV